MELSTVALPDFVKLAGLIFEKSKQSTPLEARNSGMWVIDPIPQNSGNTRDFNEIDVEEYADNKGESDQASRAKVQIGYNKIMYKKRVAKNIGISYEMRNENKYTDVVRKLTNLGALAANRMELDMQHRLTFGTATSYTDKNGATVDITVGDSLALFSTVHKLKGSSTTYRNRLAGNPVLSKGALEGMEQLVVTQTFNQLGEKVTMPFDILWTTDDPNTINTALEYLGSTAAPDFANSGVKNVYQGKYKLVKLSKVATDATGAPDSTKAKYWGLASSMFTSAHLGMWEEPHLITPSAGSNAEDVETDDWTFGVRAGFGIVIVNGAWIKFSSGDGTA